MRLVTVAGLAWLLTKPNEHLDLDGRCVSSSIEPAFIMALPLTYFATKQVVASLRDVNRPGFTGGHLV